MPRFEFEGETFNNPVELAQARIGGKWKMPILWRLDKRVWRYNELRRELANVSHKMLTQHLRADGRIGGVVAIAELECCARTDSALRTRLAAARVSSDQYPPSPEPIIVDQNSL